MTHVYLYLQTTPPGDIFAADPHVTVEGYQVDRAALELWSADDLARLHLARAEVVVPDIDPEAEALTGDHAAVPGSGGWQWVEQIRGLTADEIAARLAAAKASKVDELTRACAATITAGYVSAALGADHTYPTKATDQSNMAASVLSSLMPGLAADWTTPFWCVASDGVWAMRPHTAAQIQQAGADGKAHVLACQAKLSGDDGLGGLLKAVDDAGNVAEVATVTW